jgi:membrane-anchored protein YejM (alkaline phosphatase superfamily)
MTHQGRPWEKEWERATPLLYTFAAKLGWAFFFFYNNQLFVLLNRSFICVRQRTSACAAESAASQSAGCIAPR